MPGAQDAASTRGLRERGDDDLTPAVKMAKQRRMQTEGAVESGRTWRQTDTGNKKERRDGGVKLPPWATPQTVSFTKK